MIHQLTRDILKKSSYLFLLVSNETYHLNTVSVYLVHRGCYKQTSIRPVMWSLLNLTTIPSSPFCSFLLISSSSDWAFSCFLTWIRPTGENLTSSAPIDEREERTAEQQDMACLFDHVLLILLVNLRHLFYLYLVFPPKRLLNHVDYGCSGQVTIITGVSFQLYQSINFTIKKWW